MASPFRFRSVHPRQTRALQKLARHVYFPLAPPKYPAHRNHLTLDVAATFGIYAPMGV